MRLLWVLCLLVTVSVGYGSSHIEIQSVGLGKDGNVSCLHYESNGSLWIGFDGQGLAYRESANAVPQFYNKLSGTLPTDVILTCFSDSRNRLWFGSFGDGLFCWESGQFSRGDSLLPVLNEMRYVSSFAEDVNGTFWIGTLNEGLYGIRQDGSHVQYTKENSCLPTDNVQELTCHDGHHLFIATSWGLCLLNTDKEEIEPLKDDQGQAILERQMIRYIYQDKDSDLWIGTQNGLYRYDIPTGRCEHLISADDIPGTTVRAIAKDHQDHLWFSTEEGIGCLTVIHRQGKADAYECQSLKTETDIMFHVRAIACAPDGKILFGTSKGLMRAFLSPGEAREDKPLRFLSPILWNTLILVIFLIIVWWLYRRTGGFHRRRNKPVPMPAPQIEPTPLSITSVDQQLIERTTQIVEQNLSDTDFSVEDLSAALGMSRSHLYNRLTALTGKTPLEFIRLIRMKRGKQYLDQSGEPVSQIAWKVGLSPKQFAKYFKEEYGMLPSQYVRQQSEN